MLDLDLQLALGQRERQVDLPEREVICEEGRQGEREVGAV